MLRNFLRNMGITWETQRFPNPNLTHDSPESITNIDAFQNYVERNNIKIQKMQAIMPDDA